MVLRKENPRGVLPSGSSLLQRLPRRPLRRVPGRALPSGAGRARRRVLHPRRVERGTPALLVVPRELKVVTLAGHADGDVSDASPRVEPGAQRVERAIVRGHGAPGEADSSTQELAPLVEHALLDHLVRPE